MARTGSNTLSDTVDQYFDALVKSRFIEMFGSVKGNEKGLKKVTLKTVCSQIVDGSHNPSKGGNPSEYLMLSSKNVVDGSITHDDPRYLSKEDFYLEDKRTKVRPGDILMTIVGTIGRTAIVPMNAGNLTFQRSVAILHLDNQQVDPIFLKSCLDSIQADIDSEAHGSSQKGIYLNQVEKIPVLVPDLPIQKEFSSFVQQVDKSKAIAKQCFDKFDMLVKSRFIEMFGYIRTNSKGWKCNRLGDLGDFKTGGTPSSKHEEFYNGTFPFISTPSLGPNYIDEVAAKYFITQEAIDSCATTLIPAGSLIIGTRINVGQSAINKIPLCTNQDIVSMMNISENYDLLFLKHCIEQYVPYLDSQKIGATIKGITVDLLKSISIPEPPIDLQRQYVNFVQQVDKSKFELLERMRKVIEYGKTV